MRCSTRCRGGPRISDVATLTCHLPVGVDPVNTGPWPVRQRPATPHDVRWSLPYLLAGLLVDGEVSLDLSEPIGGEREVLAARMRHAPWVDSGFPTRFPTRVEVVMKDGRELAH